MNDQTDLPDLPFGLSAEDLAREADRFGVSDEQVRRDHAISPWHRGRNLPAN